MQCNDNHFNQFSSFADMIDFHEQQAKNSKWVRGKVNSLTVEALDESSPLFGDLSQFDSSVSEDAVKDTAAGLGLAMRVDGMYYPLRDTAYKSLLDRAKIGGTALPKLRREDLAGILNSCLALFDSDALLLIRDEKISAVHSGDPRDYSILAADELLSHLKVKLDERFPGSQFEGGYSDHAISSGAFCFPKQRDELLEAYEKAVKASGTGTPTTKLMPGIRFTTSDVGLASAKINALILGASMPIQIGEMMAVEHRWQKKTSDFAAVIDNIYAKFADTIAKLEKLTTITLSYPVNAMTAICKKLSLPKKAAMEAIQMFEMTYSGSTATAHEIFMALQEIPFILKTDHFPQNKLLSVEELLARTLSLRWSDYDYARTVKF